MIKLYSDGASRGNPGPAAAGFWAEDGDGRVLFEGSQRLPDCTNNVAEYHALRLGLERLLAAGHGGDPVAVHADSQLMIRQLEGRYKVKNAGLRPLFEEVRGLLDRFPNTELRAIPRGENAHADALANAAFEEADGGTGKRRKRGAKAGAASGTGDEALDAALEAVRHEAGGVADAVRAGASGPARAALNRLRQAVEAVAERLGGA